MGRDGEPVPSRVPGIPVLGVVQVREEDAQEQERHGHRVQDHPRLERSCEGGKGRLREHVDLQEGRVRNEQSHAGNGEEAVRYPHPLDQTFLSREGRTQFASALPYRVDHGISSGLCLTLP